MNMAKKTVVKNPPSLPPITVSEDMDLALDARPASVLTLVRTGQAVQVPTKQLAIFYVQADVIEKAIKKLKDLSRDSLVARRDEGGATGDKHQHREFRYVTAQGMCQLTVQQRQSWRPNPEKLEALLREKKLWDQVVNLRVVAEGTWFQKFLRQHRAEIAKSGVQILEEMDMEKVDGLCQAKLITSDKLESILDKPEPTWALIPKLKP
jgi:hypothetical protein